jgi:GNAT superfamily N-acetyltransferase
MMRNSFSTLSISAWIFNIPGSYEFYWRYSMLFRRVRPDDLHYIYSWLDTEDYLRQGVLESALSLGLLYGVEIDGKINGISILYPVNELAWLMGARVRREYRGKGVGGYMTKSLLNEARKRGYRAAALRTSRNNLPVHRICTSLGMEKVIELLSASIPMISFPDVVKINRLKYLNPSDYEKLFKEIKSLYPLLPLTPSGLIWAPTEYAFNHIYREASICLTREFSIALIYAGCSWNTENSCRSTLGGILINNKNIDLITSSLACLSEYASIEGIYDKILWARDSEDLVVKISPFARWIWRSYIYYIDLTR